MKSSVCIKRLIVHGSRPHWPGPNTGTNMSTFSCCGDRSGGVEEVDDDVPAKGDCSGVTYMPNELSESKRWRSSSSSRYVPLPPPPSSSGGLPPPPAPTTKQPSQAQPNKHKPCTVLVLRFRLLLRSSLSIARSLSSLVLLLCPPYRLLLSNWFRDVYDRFDRECVQARHFPNYRKCILCFDSKRFLYQKHF